VRRFPRPNSFIFWCIRELHHQKRSDCTERERTSISPTLLCLVQSLRTFREIDLFVLQAVIHCMVRHKNESCDVFNLIDTYKRSIDLGRSKQSNDLERRTYMRKEEKQKSAVKNGRVKVKNLAQQDSELKKRDAENIRGGGGLSGGVIGDKGNQIINSSGR